MDNSKWAPHTERGNFNQSILTRVRISYKDVTLATKQHSQFQKCDSND